MATVRKLTTGQREVLETLTLRVRIATEVQLHRLPANAGNSRRWLSEQLRRLQRRGLVARHRMALRLLSVERPLLTWEPGDAAPAWGPFVWQFEKRLSALRPETVAVYWPTRRAADMFGGTVPRLSRCEQFEHDLGVTDVFLVRQRQTPHSQERWISEDLLRRRFAGPLLRRVPDAAIVAPDGTVSRLIEFGGQYSVQKLKAFHAHCRRQALPYELW